MTLLELFELHYGVRTTAATIGLAAHATMDERMRKEGDRCMRQYMNDHDLFPGLRTGEFHQ